MARAAILAKILRGHYTSGFVRRLDAGAFTATADDTFASFRGKGFQHSPSLMTPELGGAHSVRHDLHLPSRDSYASTGANLLEHHPKRKADKHKSEDAGRHVVESAARVESPTH